jgi:DNA-3-methyladenine glycosylase II
MAVAVHPVQPFDFSLSLAFVRGFSPMSGEQVVTWSSLTKAVSCAGRAFAFRVHQAGGDQVLDVEVLPEGATGEVEQGLVLDRVREILSTEDDLGAFYAQASADRAMAPVVRRLRGLHQVKFPTAFEAACWGLLNQRIGLAAARTMKDRLVQRVGARVVVEGVEHRAFPEPAAVVALGHNELARLLPGGRRAEAVLAAAHAFASVDDSFLREAPLDRVRDWLRAIHGVGPFTSSLVLYRGLGRFDGAAAISPRFVQAAKALYGRRLSAVDVQAIAESYGAWGGHWMLYVWASTFAVPHGPMLDSRRASDTAAGA